MLSAQSERLAPSCSVQSRLHSVLLARTLAKPVCFLTEGGVTFMAENCPKLPTPTAISKLSMIQHNYRRLRRDSNIDSRSAESLVPVTRSNRFRKYLSWQVIAPIILGVIFATFVILTMLPSPATVPVAEEPVLSTDPRDMVARIANEVAKRPKTDDRKIGPLAYVPARPQWRPYADKDKPINPMIQPPRGWDPGMAKPPDAA